MSSWPLCPPLPPIHRPSLSYSLRLTDSLLPCSLLNSFFGPYLFCAKSLSLFLPASTLLVLSPSLPLSLLSPFPFFSRLTLSFSHSFFIKISLSLFLSLSLSFSLSLSLSLSLPFPTPFNASKFLAIIA